MWDQLEPTTSHLTYLALALFLTLYALFTHLLRNTLHLSAPPLATLYSILLGPLVLDIIQTGASFSSSSSSSSRSATQQQQQQNNDNVTQELTRLVLAVQCFAVGVDLPARWFLRRDRRRHKQYGHARSVAYLLGPVMAYAWLVAAGLARYLFNITWPAALVIGACLAPTDPVLAASVLADDAHFARHRVPRRLRTLLAAESACNDGASFPFLYLGLAAFVFSSSSSASSSGATAGDALRHWVLVTLLYQCALGLLLGLGLGRAAHFLLRFSERRGYVTQPSLVALSLLLAVLSAGVGATLGSDDFLVAFGAGVGFAHDGWFGHKADEVQVAGGGGGPADQDQVQGGQLAFFRQIVDLVLDSGVFVYFGAVIPWGQFTASAGDVLAGHITMGRLFLFLALVLLFRRIPILLALQAGQLVPDVKTYREALFCGHFGPMGVGALFLAIEARAQLETGTSSPLPQPDPPAGPPFDDKTVAIHLVWPVICFVVLGSTMVHGLSVLVISIVGSFSRHEAERAPLLGETDGLSGMVHDDSDSEG